jgi:1-acyl-sn-glycerol-3-phosphate acyltransferase
MFVINRSSRIFLATSAALFGLGTASASVAYKYRLRPSKDRTFHEELVEKHDTDKSFVASNKLEPKTSIEKWLLSLARFIAMGGSATFGAWLFTITGKHVEIVNTNGKELFDSLIASRPRPTEDDRPSSLYNNAIAKTVFDINGQSNIYGQTDSSSMSSSSSSSVMIQPDWEEEEEDKKESSFLNLDTLPDDGESAWPGVATEVPLITVCNHSSMLDDPGLQSVLLNVSTNLNHARMRWGICTEEVCFKHEGIASYFSLGKAVPVQRGGGLHQKGVAELQFALNRGEWLHIFPEGRTWQEGGSPLRDHEGRWCSASGRCSEPFARVGPLKWGVGKFLANSRILPIVIPYYHMGMQPIVPQDSRNKVAHKDGAIGLLKHVLSTPADITVKFGEPVYYKDIIEDYHISARKRALKRALKRRQQRENDSQSTAVSLLSKQSDSTEPMSSSSSSSFSNTNIAISKSISYPTPRETKSGGCASFEMLKRRFLPGTDELEVDKDIHIQSHIGPPIVPSRSLANGNIVPAYVDAPLRIRPPDFKLLTPAEEAIEDVERFKLYSRLTDRVHKALLTLSKDVLDHRKKRGVIESSFQ